MERKLSVTIVIPVYNEEVELLERIETLLGFCKTHLDSFDWEVVIADNASTDRTLEIAHTLAKKYSRVHALHLDKKGRGRAVKYAWTKSKADFIIVFRQNKVGNFPDLSVWQVGVNILYVFILNHKMIGSVATVQFYIRNKVLNFAD